MENILISIIVPAYNIEQYIGRCLESILNQEYANLEIIVVNDGSKDGTWDIINSYAQKDSRVIPINSENGGVTKARLTGIRKASGSYIGFVDGDDCIDPKMYKRLLKNALEHNADISHCGYQMVFPSRVEYYYNTGRLVQQDKMTGIKDLLTGVFIEPALCNKLYKKSLFHNMLQDNLMPESIKTNEDVLMNYWLFKEAEKSIYEDFCPYQYILRKGSAATSKISESKLKNPIEVTRIIMEDAEDIPELFDILWKRMLNQLVHVAVMPAKEQKELIVPLRGEIRKELRKKSIWTVTNTNNSLFFKIKVLWAAYLPNTYGFLHRVYSKVRGYDKKYAIE